MVFNGKQAARRQAAFNRSEQELSGLFCLSQVSSYKPFHFETHQIKHRVCSEALRICYGISRGGGNDGETDGKERRLNILQTLFALMECSCFVRSVDVFRLERIPERIRTRYRREK